MAPGIRKEADSGGKSKIPAGPCRAQSFSPPRRNAAGTVPPSKAKGDGTCYAFGREMRTSHGRPTRGVLEVSRRGERRDFGVRAFGDETILHPRSPDL